MMWQKHVMTKTKLEWVDIKSWAEQDGDDQHIQDSLI